MKTWYLIREYSGRLKICDGIPKKCKPFNFGLGAHCYTYGNVTSVFDLDEDQILFNTENIEIGCDPIPMQFIGQKINLPPANEKGI